MLLTRVSKYLNIAIAGVMTQAGKQAGEVYKRARTKKIWWPFQESTGKTDILYNIYKTKYFHPIPWHGV